MPETPVDPAAATEAPIDTENNESSEQQNPKSTETVEFWKAKARENEKRAKENASAATKLAAIEESQKSEQQKLIERAEAAEKRAEAAETLRQVGDWKAQVAANPKYVGVTADVLRGSTLDEIEAHAASLKALLPEPRQAGYVPTEGRPVTAGTGDKATQFAAFMRNQLANQ